jgi:hypothetical protein
VILEERGALSVKKLAKAKPTAIVDITSDEHVRQGKQPEEKKASEEVTVSDALVKKTDKKKPTADKQQQAYQKMKMQQQGGDRAKSHRRKSMSEG